MAGNWYKLHVSDVESQCKITGITCDYTLCKFCSVAEAYEQSSARQWGVV